MCFQKHQAAIGLNWLNWYRCNKISILNDYVSWSTHFIASIEVQCLPTSCILVSMSVTFTLAWTSGNTGPLKFIIFSIFSYICVMVAGALSQSIVTYSTFSSEVICNKWEKVNMKIRNGEGKYTQALCVCESVCVQARVCVCLYEHVCVSMRVCFCYYIIFVYKMKCVNG